MDMHAHDRWHFLALTAAASAAPLLSSCGAGFGDDGKQGGGSAADNVTGSSDGKPADGRSGQGAAELGGGVPGDLRRQERHVRTERAGGDWASRGRAERCPR
jgi:hypothetical protein